MQDCETRLEAGTTPATYLALKSFQAGVATRDTRRTAAYIVGLSVCRTRPAHLHMAKHGALGGKGSPAQAPA